VLAGIFLGTFLFYTAFVIKGQFDLLTLQQEQWLLQRPLTRFDCVAEQWKNLGEIPASLVLMLGLCAVVWLLGYRRRVALALLLLLGIGIGCEYLGKQVVQQPVTVSISAGMNTLACPQLAHQSRLSQFAVSIGMWWVAPAPHNAAIRREQRAANSPILGEEGTYAYGYPSGHALRCMLLGLLACWLAWRHLKRPWLRWGVTILAFVLAFSGGLAIFYIGGHLLTDVIGGYLLGACLACCAIALLRLNETGRRRARQSPTTLRKTDPTGHAYPAEKAIDIPT
jgi:membrane-associated phospholipid phosphatase